MPHKKLPPFKSWEEAAVEMIELMQRVVDDDPGHLIPAKVFLELSRFQFRMVNTAAEMRRKK